MAVKRIAALVFILLFLALPNAAFASTYGSGAYSSCAYGQDCSQPGTSATANSNSGSASATSPVGGRSSAPVFKSQAATNGWEKVLAFLASLALAGLIVKVLAGRKGIDKYV